MRGTRRRARARDCPPGLIASCYDHRHPWVKTSSPAPRSRSPGQASSPDPMLISSWWGPIEPQSLCKCFCTQSTPFLSPQEITTEEKKCLHLLCYLENDFFLSLVLSSYSTVSNGAHSGECPHVYRCSPRPARWSRDMPVTRSGHSGGHTH